jgi:alpha-amylase/alpha-mannosidase (GH57 family)
MEMIPYLKRMGYSYVMVDSNNVEPVDSMKWQELRYKPHLARFEEDEIIVIVRDRELSDAQESGMDLDWFNSELNERTKWCDFEPLVTTCTDGDNGGWFRNTSPEGNFWDYFYKNLLRATRANQTNIRPTFISDYLKNHGVSGYVNVKTAAWNTGWHNGIGFTQWTGSQKQRDALERIKTISNTFHLTKNRAIAKGAGDLFAALNEAQWHLLRSETSCNFFWGEAWVQKSHDDLDTVENILEGIYQKLE